MFTSNIQKSNYCSAPHLYLPNVVSRRQILHKVLDVALTIASCVGIVAIMLFFIVISL